MNAQEIAKRIAEAKANRRGNYFRQGKGVAVVKNLISGGKPDFYEGDTFVGEFLIESAQSTPGAKDENGQPEEANPPGSSISYVQKFTTFPETAFANVQKLLGALDEDAVAQYASVTGPPSNPGAQPLRGVRVAYECFSIKTKKKGLHINVVEFSHIPGQTSEQIAQARAWVERAALPAPGV